ncbi:hypothetical protein X801_01904, partial [Opisthorchis viverrini]
SPLSHRRSTNPESFPSSVEGGGLTPKQEGNASPDIWKNLIQWILNIQNIQAREVIITSALEPNTTGLLTEPPTQPWATIMHSKLWFTDVEAPIHPRSNPIVWPHECALEHPGDDSVEMNSPPGPIPYEVQLPDCTSDKSGSPYHQSNASDPTMSVNSFSVARLLERSMFS